MKNDSKYDEALRSTWGLPERDNEDLALQLAGQGMAEHEINAWCDALVPGNSKEVARLALAWASEGVEACTAIRFCLSGDWLPHEASAYVALGYLPNEANFVETMLRWNARSVVAPPGSPSASTSEEWISSGLSPSWVCLCLGAGVRHVDKARQLQKENLTATQVAVGLEIDAVVRGINVRSLKFAPRRS